MPHTLRFAPFIDFAGPLPPGEPYRPQTDRILAGDPVQTAHNFYSSADGRFQSGVWTCQPGKWRVVFTEHEFCQLLEGVLVSRPGSLNKVVVDRCLASVRTAFHSLYTEGVRLVPDRTRGPSIVTIAWWVREIPGDFRDRRFS